VAADEAAISNKALFARGEVKINADWTAYFNGTLTRNTSFGRYAPVPGEVRIEPGTAGDLLGRRLHLLPGPSLRRRRQSRHRDRQQPVRHRRRRQGLGHGLG
jgi:hypothetical protein